MPFAWRPRESRLFSANPQPAPVASSTCRASRNVDSKNIITHAFDIHMNEVSNLSPYYTVFHRKVRSQPTIDWPKDRVEYSSTKEIFSLPPTSTTATMRTE